MTHDAVAALFARHNDAMNRHDVPALMDLYAPDCALSSPMAGNVTGRDAIEHVYRAWFKAFPDVTTRSEQLVVDDDQVVSIETVSGTDTGGFMGLPATQKAFTFSMVRLFTLRNDQIAQERRIYDFTGMLVQIGVLKAKPA